MRYRSIESLKQYLLVDSRQMQVDLFTRLNDETWQYWPGTLPKQVVDLHSVGLPAYASRAIRGHCSCLTPATARIKSFKFDSGLTAYLWADFPPNF